MSDNPIVDNPAENMANGAVTNPPGLDPEGKEQQNILPLGHNDGENCETRFSTDSSPVAPAQAEPHFENLQQAQPPVPEKDPEQAKNQLVNPLADEYEKVNFDTKAQNGNGSGDEKSSAGDGLLANSHPPITGAGTEEADQVDRRKRMFAAKSILMQNPSNHKRKKRRK